MDQFTKDRVISMLKAADGSNTDATQRKMAAIELDNAANQVGFHAAMLSVWTDASEEGVRQMAAIYFRNSFLKHLLRVKNNELQQEKTNEAEHCKDYLLKNFASETNPAVMKQIANAIGRIARTHWPKNWYGLFPAITSRLDTPNSQAELYNAVLVLQEVLDSLSSVRIACLRLPIIETFKSLLPPLRQLWTKSLKEFLTSYEHLFQGQSDADIVKSATIHALCASRCLYRVLTNGTSEIHKSQDVGLVFQDTVKLLQTIIDQLYPNVAKQTELEFHSQLIAELAETVIEMVTKCQRFYPIAFRPFLLPFLESFTKILKRYRSKRISNEKIIPKVYELILGFLSGVLTCPAYVGKSTSGIRFDGLTRKVDFDEKGSLEAKKIRDIFFSEENVIWLTKILITDFFVLDQEDFDRAEQDPEGYFMQYINDSVGTRPSARRFFKYLMKKFRNISPLIVTKLFREAAYELAENPDDASTAGKALTREAIYLSFGLEYFYLFQPLQKIGYFFPELWKKVFVKDITSNSEHLRCRAVWLLGCLVDDVSKASTDIRTEVFQVLSNGLADPSPLVRLASAWSLDKYVITCQFHIYKEQFMPFLDAICEKVLIIIGQSVELDTQTFLLNCIRDIIRQLGIETKGIARGLLVAFSGLWQRCEKTNLLRSSIVDTVTDIVKVLNEGGQDFESFFINLIQYSTSQTDDKGYLVERGLRLWVAVLRQSSRLSPGLLNLLENNWAKTFKDSTAYTQDSVQVLKSYLILGKLDLWRKIGERVISLLVSQLNGLDESGIDIFCDLIEMMGQLNFPPADFKAVYEKMLEYLLRNPDMRKKRISAILTLFARFFLQDFHSTLAVIRGLEQQHNTPLLKQLLTKWVAEFKTIAMPYKQRTAVIALGMFLEILEPPDFQDIGVPILKLAIKINADYEADKFTGCVEEEEDPHSLCETTETDRIIKLIELDPGNHIKIAPFFIEKLKSQPQNIRDGFVHELNKKQCLVASNDRLFRTKWPHLGKDSKRSF